MAQHDLTPQATTPQNTHAQHTRTEASSLPPDAPPSRRGFGLSRIAGLPWPYFLVLLLIVLAAAYFELLPTNIVSGMALAMLLGFGLKALGDAIPVFNTFGGERSCASSSPRSSSSRGSCRSPS